MLKQVQMPKLGQTVDEAVIETWRCKEGDAVKKGDVLLDITTDKATLEVESYVTGVVKRLLYPQGATVPVNVPIAFVGAPDDVLTDEMVQQALAAAAHASSPSVAAVHVASAAAEPAAAEAAVAVAAPAGRTFASPRARRVARERRIPLQLLRGSGPNGRIVESDVLAQAERLHGLRATPTALELAWQRGVDLTKLRPSGIDGRIMKADVEAAAAAPAPAPVGRRVPLSPMRRIVAQRMTLSKATIPHFYLTMDVDMTKAVELRRSLMESKGQKVAFNDLLIRACTLAFGALPEMNCAWADGAILYRDEVNIGIAVGLDSGLIVPVVRNCERRSLAEIAQETEALIAKARNKRLTPDEYEGGCMTISNLGMFCIDTVAPIINPGEVAILGVGRIARRPVVIGEGIAVRQMTTLTIACDHRLVDGVIGAKFLKKVKEALEAPACLP